MSTATASDPSAAPSRRANPYVGPRAFRYGESLYGRNREITDLRDLIISERVVLLYSPSGAGKSSLLEAGLRGALGERAFTVLPTIRVSHEAPPGFGELEFRNRYIGSMLLSLEEARRPAHQLAVSELVSIQVTDYLQRCDDALAPGSDACLVFDQFEELFTLDATDHGAKTEFLGELGVALRNRGRWALFAMREDFIAQLDPYLALIPTRLSARYRLELLSPGAAKLAAQAPADSEGVDFTDAAADRLIDDLRTVHVQRGVSVTDELGPSIEPVQLQVVCRQLWDTLPPDATAVLVDDVTALGDVDDALAAFYVEQVAEVAGNTGVREREIRDWFDDVLITAEGFRAQTLEGPGDDGAAVLRQLEDAHLVRGDQRRGARWYELAHDRLVGPIRTSNRMWREEHLSTLQREAKTWDSHSRPAGLLMRGEVLREAEQWAATHPAQLSSIDDEYLQACRQEASRAERERRASRRNLRLAILAVIVSILAVVGLVAAVRATKSANRQRHAAKLAAAQALMGQATLTKDTDPPLAMALAAEAHQRDASPETDKAVEDMYTAFVNSGLTRTLAGHHQGVTAVTFTPDGSLISAGDDGMVRISDPASGRLLRRFVADPKGVTSIALAPDGSTLATANDDGTVGLWDVASGMARSPLVGEQGSLSAVAYNRAGSRLASGSDDGTVVVWDTATGQTVGRLHYTGRRAVTSIAFNKQGTRLAVERDDGTTTLWDPATGERRGPPVGRQREKVTGVAFSPDGALLATSAVDGTTKLWDAETGEERRNLSGDTRRFLAVAFSPDGKTVATGSDGRAQLWNVTTGQLLRTLAGHRGAVNAVAFSPSGDTLATGGEDHTVKVWTASTGSQLDTLRGHEDRVRDVAFSPDGSLLASASIDKTVRIWDVKTRSEKLMALQGHEKGVFGVAFSPDGSLVASASADGTARLWSTTTGQPLRSLIGHKGGVNDVAFSHDGTLVATAGDDATARIWDAKTGRPLQKLSGHDDAVLALAFSPHDDLLATASDDTTVKLWDPRSGRLIRTLKGHGDAVLTVAFSHDGSLLASGGDDKDVRLWDPKTGRTVRTLKGHAGSVSTVTFRPDDDVLASANSDGTIGLWDPKSGNELKSLSGHDRRVWAVAYNNDGTLLASGGADTTVRLWKPVVITADNACEIAAPHLPRQVLVDQIGEPKACTNLK